jgi:hypothetical protein
MTNEELARKIRCNWFADRDSLDEAFEYAHMVMKGDPAAMTAMYVILNTVAKEILKLEQKETV